MDDLAVVKTSTEKVTADMVEKAGELEIQVQPEYVTELLPSHDKMLIDKQLDLWMSKESDFLK